jgi:hypothetical protein
LPRHHVLRFGHAQHSSCRIAHTCAPLSIDTTSLLHTRPHPSPGHTLVLFLELTNATGPSREADAWTSSVVYFLQLFTSLAPVMGASNEAFSSSPLVLVMCVTGPNKQGDGWTVRERLLLCQLLNQVHPAEQLCSHKHIPICSYCSFSSIDRQISVCVMLCRHDRHVRLTHAAPDTPLES